MNSLDKKNKKYSKQGDTGGGDKGTIHSYIEHYEKLLEPYRKSINFLEIGMWEGSSLKMWDEYFIDSNVVGVEILESRTGGLHLDPNYNVIIHDATKLSFLDIIKNETFDVIIDDGSHYLHEQIQTFHLLKNKVNKNGIYIIEDIKDIDYSRRYFEDSLHHNCEILDLRHVKKRKDDVLVIYKF
jgi:spermidine synthase